jgi:hypothetical protein
VPDTAAEAWLSYVVWLLGRVARRAVDVEHVSFGDVGFTLYRSRNRWESMP